MSATKAVTQQLDTNINVLHALMKRGERLSQNAIAKGVGCSRTHIDRIERKAMSKVRRMLEKVKRQ